MPGMINVVQPSLGERELSAIREVFESNWVGRGTKVEEFQEGFARHIGVGEDHVLSVNSCTEATFLAMELADIGPGDEVVLPTICFVGVANAIASRGARPVFCDVDRRTLNPTVADIEAVLTSRTKAVAILHYGGYPGEVAQIAALCQERGIQLIEDAAVSVASTVDGKACGTFGDFGVWSFDYGKIVVTVDGGMLYVRDPELAARAPKLAYFGLEQTSGYNEALRSRTRWWEFQVSSFSRRSISNDVLAAVGSVQLDRLPGFIERRAEIAAHYDRELDGLDGLHRPPPLPEGHTTSHYMYWIQLDDGIRDDVARDLYARGIYTTFRYAQLHKVKAYGADVRLPQSDAASASTLLLPIHQGLSDADVERIVGAVRDSVSERRGHGRHSASPVRKAA